MAMAMGTTSTRTVHPHASRSRPRGSADDGLVVVLRHGDTHAAVDADRLDVDAELGVRRRGPGYGLVEMPIGRSNVDRLVMLQPDVVVILLGHDAFDVARLCADLAAAVTTRIIVVAGGPVDEATVVATLDAGADDVVPDGTSDAVLDARIRVALRTLGPRAGGRAPIEIGDVTIDQRAHRVHVAGEVVRCPPVQYVLLSALAERPNAAIAHTDLLRTVWGALPGDVHPRRLRIAISVLRGILGDGPMRPIIESVPRLGYRLTVPAH